MGPAVKQQSEPRSIFPSQGLALTALAEPVGAWAPPGLELLSFDTRDRSCLGFLELWTMLNKKLYSRTNE